jgi:hypothetical protein
MLLELTGSVREAATVEDGEYDPDRQVWSTVRDAETVEDALKIFASGTTTHCGTTRFEKRKYKDREIDVADDDDDDTST